MLCIVQGLFGLFGLAFVLESDLIAQGMCRVNDRPAVFFGHTAGDIALNVTGHCSAAQAEKASDILCRVAEVAHHFKVNRVHFFFRCVVWSLNYELF